MWEISLKDVVIGSLQRVYCSETYKQSTNKYFIKCNRKNYLPALLVNQRNRNDNKTNNKDTQPRFEQDSTQELLLCETTTHRLSSPTKLNSLLTGQEAIRESKQAGRRFLTHAARIASVFVRHPKSPRQIFLISKWVNSCEESLSKQSAYSLSEGRNWWLEDAERLVVVSCPRTRGPVTHFG